MNLAPGEILATNSGPACHNDGTTLYTYRLAMYPAQDYRSEEWFADWTCATCKCGGAIFLGNSAPVDVAGIRATHTRVAAIRMADKRVSR